MKRGVVLLLLVPAAAQASAEGVRFVDVAAESGLHLRNLSGAGPEKWTILESTGAGACFLDREGDGDLDLYLVNGGTLAARGQANPVRDALYDNDGTGRFTDVTAAVGIAEQAWGGGCAVGDYDNDGDPDLYVTNFGPDALYRNDGGAFREVTAAAGLGDPRWGVGAVFFDADRDGDLDLYVANYLAFDPSDPRVLAQRCRWKGGEVMCGPRGFTGEPDALYRNRGDGTFEDASAAAGLGGDVLYGMGAVAGDLDADGDADLFVANDSQENLLWVNDGSGRFTDQALPAGVALSGDGRAQAGMGADLGDADGDGDEDLFVTNFSDDYHTLYRNEGELVFTDASAAAGLDPVTRPSLGWGGGFFDFDNDRDLDLFVASGHVYPGVERFDPATTYHQRNLLLENDGRGRFKEMSAAAGPGFALRRGGRGAAFGDVDDDGDLDVVVVNENDVPTLLRNDGGNARSWIKLKLVGRRSNRDGIGTRVALTAGGRTQVREARLAGGYASSHDPRLHFGLGGATVVERVELRWPSGRVQVLTGLAAGHLVTVDEERGVVTSVPLGDSRLPAPAAGGPPSAPPTPAVSAPPAPSTPAPAPARRLTAADLAAVDRLVQGGTREILAGRHLAGIEAYEQALARLPVWEAAAASPDALGFGGHERYRAFRAALFDNLGVGQMRAERLDACAVSIERALALQPERTKFHYNLGLCHYHAHRYAEAVAALSRAAAALDAPAGAHYDLGRALAAAGRCGEAEEELAQALAELPRPDPRGRDAEAWYHLGGCRLDGGRPAEAVAAFREALARVPGHQKALYKLAQALARQGAEGAASSARALFTARQPAEEALRSLKRAGADGRADRLRLARTALDSGVPPTAVLETQELLAADPSDLEALLLLGDSLLALRPPAAGPAEEVFRRALAFDPARPEALAGLALCRAREALAAGDAADAAERLRTVLRDRPDNPRLLTALAAALLVGPSGSADRAAEALALLDRAGRLYGEGEETRLAALALLGRKEEARRLLAESPFLGQTEREELARRLALD